PAMLRRHDTGAEDIEESIHFAFHLIAILPNRMMQPGGEFDRNGIPDGRDKRPGDQTGIRKSIGSHSAGAQLEPEGEISRRVHLGQNGDGALSLSSRALAENTDS